MSTLIDRSVVNVNLQHNPGVPGISIPCFVDPRAAPDQSIALVHQIVLAIASLGQRVARVEHAIVELAGESTAMDAVLAERPALESIRGDVAAMKARFAEAAEVMARTAAERGS